MLARIILYFCFDPVLSILELEIWILLTKKVCICQEISFSNTNLEIALVIQTLWDWICISVNELSL